MAATAWALTDEGRRKLVDGVFDLDTDVFKVALHLVASNIGPASTSRGLPCSTKWVVVCLRSARLTIRPPT